MSIGSSYSCVYNWFDNDFKIESRYYLIFYFCSVLIVFNSNMIIIAFGCILQVIVRIYILCGHNSGFIFKLYAESNVNWCLI